MGTCGRWLKELDDLLRGNKTGPEKLAMGTEHLPAPPMLINAVILGLVYGAFMGLYGVIAPEAPRWEQFIASTLKVPALFLLTLVVTFPSLYVFSALLGVALSPLAVVRIVVASITVNLCVLAAFGPITGFFTLTTTSYPFMKLLNVFFFAIAGFIGLGFLVKVLRNLDRAQRLTPTLPLADPGTPPPPGMPAMPPSSVHIPRIFKVWLIVYAFVGLQMAWVLRPFVGDPRLDFTWFRQRGGNVFLDLLKTFERLLAG
jgi:hypothetical protein